VSANDKTENLPHLPLLWAVGQLANGATVLGHKSDLQIKETAGIRIAILTKVIKQRSRKRKYAWTDESLAVG
jgi:hypothetical protein